MTLKVMNPRQSEGTLQGRHVLMGFIAFFGVIFAVNGVFLYKALSTHTGVVANEPYRKGLAYNERIAADVRQADLGWSDALVVERSGRITLQLSKATGELVQGMVVVGSIGRPATSGSDRKLVFAEDASSYLTDAGPLAEGNWIVELAVSARVGEEPLYRLRKRLWLKP
jgi:nitrogen fixation protein FixH